MEPPEDSGRLVIEASLCDLSMDHRRIQQHLKSNSPVRMKGLPVRVEEKSMEESGISAFCSTNPTCAPIDCAPSVEPTGELRGDSVALLLCEVFGGRLPTGLGDPGKVTLRLRLGRTVASATCSAAPEGRVGELSEATMRTIESLSGNGVEHTVIAGALGLEPVDVARVIRKKGVNLGVPQPFRLLLAPEDLECEENLEMTALDSHGTALATGVVPIARLCWIEAHSEVVTLLPPGLEQGHVELDVELRLFAVVPRAQRYEAPDRMGFMAPTAGSKGASHEASAGAVQAFGGLPTEGDPAGMTSTEKDEVHRTTQASSSCAA